MKLARLITLLVAISSLTTLAWAAGLDAETLREWPWATLILLSLPFVGTALYRLRMPR